MGKKYKKEDASETKHLSLFMCVCGWLCSWYPCIQGRMWSTLTVREWFLIDSDRRRWKLWRTWSHWSLRPLKEMAFFCTERDSREIILLWSCTEPNYSCMSTWVMWLKRTTCDDGLLIGCDPTDLFLSLFLVHVSISGSNQYGSIRGHTSVSSGSLLDDDHWHSVLIERYRRSVNFTLDNHTQSFRTNGEFDHLDLDYEVNQNKVMCQVYCFCYC